MLIKTKKFLEELPILRQSIKANSLLIIPTGKIYDSGYETMVYVVEDIETKVKYKTNGSSDVLDFMYTKGWKIECIPQHHAIQLWRGIPFVFTPWYSSAEIRE